MPSLKKIIISAVIGGIILLLMPPQVYAGTLRYHGAYQVENGFGMRNMHELKGSMNSFVLPYSPRMEVHDIQSIASRVKENGFKVDLRLPFAYMEDNGRTFSNENGALTDYLTTLKRRISVDSDLINNISFIDVDEEWDTLLGQQSWHYTQLGEWQIFKGKESWEQTVIMKRELERVIGEVKQYFPGIPVKIVENNWIPYSAPPPDNLDILGLDLYFIPTSGLCDNTQRERFDDMVTSNLNWVIRNYPGKSIYLVGPAFDDGNYKPLSPCQTQWYYDIAQSTPSIIGLDWYFYTSVYWASGFRENFPEQREYIKQKGREIISALNPADTTPPTVSITSPTNGATVSGSSVSITANASDNIGVVGVQFKLDGGSLGPEDTVAPYSTTFNSILSGNGVQSIYAIARDEAGNTSTSAVTVTVANTTKPVNQLPKGNFDDISSGVIKGWSYDPDSSSSSNDAHIYVNGPAGQGTLVSGVITNIDRADVNAAFGITGKHGFEYAIPEAYRNGQQYSFYVYGIDYNDATKNTLLTGSPKIFKQIITPTLSVSSSSVVAGNPVTATWSNISNPTSQDWIGLYTPTSSNNPSLAWVYVSCSQSAGITKASGSCSLTIPSSTAAGTYQLRLLASGGYTSLAQSANFTVTAAAVGDTTPPVISSVTASAVTQTDATITWTTNEPSDGQIVFPTGPCPGGTNCGTPIVPTLITNHSINLGNSLTPGTTYTYQVKSRDAAGNLATSATFTFTTQSAPSSTLSVSPSSVTAGQSVTATWSNIQNPTPQDWVGLYAPSGSSASPLNWVYVSCSQSPDTAKASGSCPLAIPSSFTPGTYQLRLLSAGGYTILAQSQNFTVTAPVATNPPVISSITSKDITTSTATITWNTDKAADSQIEFCTTSTRCGTRSEER